MPLNVHVTNAKENAMKTNANNAPETSAADAYQAKANDIARLIDVLQMELDKHADAAKTDPKNWGKVGDLGKVRSELIDLVGFMSGMNREAIESFLAE
jgi:hypothetical protein